MLDIPLVLGQNAPKMMLEPWLIGVVALTVGIGFSSGWLAGHLGTLRLRALVTSLQFDVATLEERLLREIKTRAGNLGVKARKTDEELLEQLKLTPAAQKPDEPWWMKHVHPDLTKH